MYPVTVGLVALDIKAILQVQSRYTAVAEEAVPTTLVVHQVALEAPMLEMARTMVVLLLLGQIISAAVVVVLVDVRAMVQLVVLVW